MKRSEINRELKWAKQLLKNNSIVLPPFGYWSTEKWQAMSNAAQLIVKVMLGWDITDYGRENFRELGAVLFTLRNGSLENPLLGTPYAEKLILLHDGQRLPLHYHASKTEDIINRAGGVLVIKLYNSLPDGGVDYDSAVQVLVDGVEKTFSAGQEIELRVGSSITLRPFVYHIFGAKAGSGDLVCGEVSSINDDYTDNYNAEEVSRFAVIEEDEPALHPLCHEYRQFLGM